MAVKTLRPFFSYYGGKWRDALRLYPEPEYKTVIEPFAGSAGYSLRHPDKSVILYEIDPVFKLATPLRIVVGHQQRTNWRLFSTPLKA